MIAVAFLTKVAVEVMAEAEEVIMFATPSRKVDFFLIF